MRVLVLDCIAQNIKEQPEGILNNWFFDKPVVK